MGQTGQADKVGTILTGHAGIKTEVTGSVGLTGSKVERTIRYYGFCFRKLLNKSYDKVL